MIVLLMQLVNRSKMETKRALQSSVYNAGRWFDNNHFPINIKKTKCMLIATGDNLYRVALEEHTLSLQLSGITLELLAVPWPSTRWQAAMGAHVQKFCRNVSSKLAVLNRLRRVLNKNYFANSTNRMHTILHWLCRFCLGFMLRASQRHNL